MEGCEGRLMPESPELWVYVPWYYCPECGRPDLNEDGECWFCVVEL